MKIKCLICTKGKDKNVRFPSITRCVVGPPTTFGRPYGLSNRPPIPPETLLFRPDSSQNPVGKETPVPGEFRTSVVGATWQGPKKYLKTMPIKDTKQKKEYFKSKDQMSVRIRLNSEEQSVLNSMMKEEGWENKSGYIKYILFGDDPNIRYNKIVKKKDPNEILMICAMMLRELNMYLNYIRYRYEKDMNQLYLEQGVDIKKWIKSTNDPHIKAIQIGADVYGAFKVIANELGIDIPSVHLGPKGEYNENINKQELDKISEELFNQGKMPISKTDWAQVLDPNYPWPKDVD